MKNITKAIASLLIAMGMIFALSGCGGGETPTDPDQNETDNSQTVEKTAVERLVGINIGPGEKAALINGQMQKVQDECPGDANGVWQSNLERHFHYEIDPNTGDHLIAFCSPNSPFKVEVNGGIRDDYTLLILSGDKKTISIKYVGFIDENGELGFYSGTLGIAWSESDTGTAQDYNGNVFDIVRYEEGDEVVFESYSNGSLETVTKSKDGFGVTSFEEK